MLKWEKPVNFPNNICSKFRTHKRMFDLCWYSLPYQPTGLLVYYGENWSVGISALAWYILQIM